MVYAFSPLFYELAHRSFRIGRLQQLDLGLTDHKKSGLNLLVSHLLNIVAFQAQNLFIEGQRLGY